MTLERLRTGKKGEELARRFLKKQGYRIVERNYRTRYGEIDIIGKDKGCIVFIEVRSRTGDDFGSPEESIGSGKQAQISKAALTYIKKKHLENENCRFDVVCIKGMGSKFMDINLIKNAFELDVRYRY